MSTAAKVLIGAAIASAGWYYFTLYKPEHSLTETQQRIYRDQVKEVEKRLAKGDVSSLGDYAVAKIQRDAVVNAVNHPEDIAPVCGGHSVNNNSDYLAFDVGQCPDKKEIMLLVPDPHHQRIFQLNLLRGGRSEPLTSDSAVKPLKEDGFNHAKHLGNGRWELKGDLVFVYEGYGNRVEGRLVE